MEGIYRGVEIRFERSGEDGNLVYQAVVDEAKLVCRKEETILAMIDGLLDADGDSITEVGCR